jgi:hypothetical protein
MRASRRPQSIEERLRAWARDVVLPILREEHAVAHDSFKARRSKACVEQCKPYLDAIAGYRKAVRR